MGEEGADHPLVRDRKALCRPVYQPGNVAKPLRLALGACIIQAEYGYADEETALQIQENPYLQYGYPGYDDSKLPFDPSLMVYFRKRRTPEILGEINEIIVSAARKGEHRHDDDDNRGNGGNRGTMIVDATCAPSNIRYPQDASLLNEARENTEKLLDELHDPADGRKPRTYRAQAHRDYLQFSRSRKKTAKKIRKAVGKQLRYLARNLAAIDEKLALSRTLSEGKKDRLGVFLLRYLQRGGKSCCDGRTVPGTGESLSKPDSGG